jgi:hypothetical protein
MHFKSLLSLITDLNDFEISGFHIPDQFDTTGPVAILSLRIAARKIKVAASDVIFRTDIGLLLQSRCELPRCDHPLEALRFIKA